MDEKTGRASRISAKRKRMITIKLWGGLCNQMFQYAFGYAMAKRQNDEMCFDIDFYKNQPNYVDKRQAELEKMSSTRMSIVERPQFVKLFQPRIVSLITRKLNFFHCQCGQIVYVKEKEHTFSNRIPYIKGADNYYDGYWQSEKYFEEYSEEIRELFSPPQEVIEKVGKWYSSFSHDNTVAIHVRRGDMVGKTEGYNEKEILEYYVRAMNYFSQRLQNITFVVFSDDIVWCKENLPSEYGKLIFQDNNWISIDDLCGIAMCNNGIMSQSTFSWWGNWLGEDKNRIVVAPKGNYFNSCFIPERWNKL